MQISEELIRNLVTQVIKEVQSSGQISAGGSPFSGRFGVFDDADQAVAAAREAFEELRKRPISDRKKAIDHIRRISIDQSVELGTMEMNETKIGRLEHKIAKLRTLGRTCSRY